MNSSTTDNPQQEEQVVIILRPPKIGGMLNFCDRCGKYVAEMCTPETQESCEK